MSAILKFEDFQKFLTQLVMMVNEAAGPIETLYNEFSLMDEQSQARFVQCVYGCATQRETARIEEIAQRKELILADAELAMGTVVKEAIAIGEFAEVTKEMTEVLVTRTRVFEEAKVSKEKVEEVIEAPVEEVFEPMVDRGLEIPVDPEAGKGEVLGDVVTGGEEIPVDPEAGKGEVLEDVVTGGEEIPTEI